MLRDTLHKICLKALPPENAHKIALLALKTGLGPDGRVNDSALRTHLWGQELPNPLGTAAGFDKNGEVIHGLFRMGFGFVEVGTVTPQPQTGNPPPRIFRMNNSLFNCLGFNNHGVERVARRLRESKSTGLIGVNLGPNKSSASFAEDYLFLLDKVSGLVDYVVLNVSSPNTPGLRSLHEKDNMERLLRDVRMKFQGTLVLKLSPDEEEKTYREIVNIALEHELDGIIMGNSTQHFHMGKIGGLTGEALSELATEKLNLIYSYTQGKIPLISTGGISTGDHAYERIKAGANLLQIYTVMVYKGFGVVRDILERLSFLLRRDGFSHVSQAVGTGPRGEIGRRA